MATLCLSMGGLRTAQNRGGKTMDNYAVVNYYEDINGAYTITKLVLNMASVEKEVESDVNGTTYKYTITGYMTKSHPRTLGERMRSIRENNGWTQQKFSNIIGVAQPLYNKWENDRNRPNYEMLAKIAKELGTSTDYLIVGNNKNG